MSCDFPHQDGAYVLGALSPAERLAFERHLAGCSDCARAVRELAGIPGLLSRVDPSVVESLPRRAPVPDTLLPTLVQAVRRRQRRRGLLSAGVAATAVVAAAVVPLAVSGTFNGDRAPDTPAAVGTAPPSASRAMVPVGGAPVEASLAFDEVPWGTRLDLTCTYAPRGHTYHLPAAASYILVVRTRNGTTQQVGTWRPLEGETMRLTAATSASRENIALVEVRETDGTPVLRLTA